MQEAVRYPLYPSPGAKDRNGKPITGILGYWTHKGPPMEQTCRTCSRAKLRPFERRARCEAFGEDMPDDWALRTDCKEWKL